MKFMRIEQGSYSFEDFSEGESLWLHRAIGIRTTGKVWKSGNRWIAQVDGGTTSPRMTSRQLAVAACLNV